MPETKGSRSYVGLKDIVYAVLESDSKDGVSYGPIKNYAPAKTASIAPSSTNNPEYADDGVLDVVSSNGAYTLTLGTAGVDDEVKAEILGAKYKDGVTEYHKDRVAPFVAIGFRSMKADGNYGYVWLLKGKFSNPSREHNTKEDTATPQTDTIEGMFIDRKFDGLTMATLDTSKASEEKINTFFEQVYGAEASTPSNPPETD
ncbi:phage tail protein [Shouchella clausii]|uniref:major tail protein n=1 Tax=Shouchella clausii TaxID=79880 RepID=UPI002E1F9473|nr:major tail protein [Shouchella clausii]MED4159627.1 phage tail protein [Shouchella clausii]MED4177002.1 phage tail protein [Shouchella clausii]